MPCLQSDSHHAQLAQEKHSMLRSSHGLEILWESDGQWHQLFPRQGADKGPLHHFVKVPSCSRTGWMINMTMTMMIDHKGKSTVHAILPGKIVRIFELNIWNSCLRLFALQTEPLSTVLSLWVCIYYTHISIIYSPFASTLEKWHDHPISSQWSTRHSGLGVFLSSPKRCRDLWEKSR